MTLELWRIVIDFGLVVLIWLTQLIIYPGMKTMSEDRLRQWHRTYTPRMAAISGPLMLAQLVLSSSALFDEPSVWSIVIFILVLATWAATFFVFIPLHARISSDTSISQLVDKLVQYNWSRTVLWSLIFIIDLVMN